MKLITTATALAGAVLLVGCGQQADKNAAAPTNATTETPATTESMGNMSMPTEPAKTAKGTGTVKAIDTAASTITLDHGPIAAANWPAMTMAFKASPALLEQVAVGDEVAFDLKLEGGSGEVTSVRKR